MCNTPTYCDLGKAAKDIFNKGYGKYAVVHFQFGVRVSVECLLLYARCSASKMRLS